jgi:hypothetical protein
MKISKILNSNLLIIWLVLLAGLYAFSLWERQADPDDAWIGEHAYWLAKDGHAHSELMRGITNQEDYLVVHHKLLNLQGALFIRIFGFSLYTLKSVSLLYFALFAFLLFYYLRHTKRITGKGQITLTFLLLLTFPWLFKFSFVYRPEVMIMALTFASWICLEKVIEGRRNMLLNSLIAGLLGGLCFSTHLNGIIVAAAGFLLLLINRKYSPALMFASGALATASLYFYDFTETYNWNYWVYQLTQSPALDSIPTAHPLLRPFINLANEHQRFFHNPMIIFFSAFMIFSLVIGFRLLKSRWRNMLLYTTLLALLLGMVAAHKARHYLLIYIPFVMIMIADVAYYILMNNKNEHLNGWRGKKWSGIILAILLLAFLLSGLFYNFSYSREKFRPGDNARLTARYISEDPATINIVAPMTFIFNEIERYNRIQADLCYYEMSKSDPAITGIGFLEKTKEFDIRYIILSPFERIRLGWDKPGSLKLPEDYVILSEEDDENLVIKRIK